MQSCTEALSQANVRARDAAKFAKSKLKPGPPATCEVLSLSLSIALAATLALLLAHRLHLARLRRRQISPPAMRVHVSLQRLRRQGCETAQLPAEDVAALREQLGWRRRRLWDRNMLAYEQARCADEDAALRHLEQLLTLTALR